MKTLTIFALVFAILLGGDVAAGLGDLGPQELLAYSTTTGTSPSSIATLSTSTTTLQTIYTSTTSPAYDPVQMIIMNLAAEANKSTGIAHYEFDFGIRPDLNLAYCSTSISSPHGKLSEVPVAHCPNKPYWSPKYNSSMPAHFSFAWKHHHNGTVLILRSTNPASANHCPDFPHDACWAQALFWVSPDDIWRYDGVEVYVAPGLPLLYLNGTYCKSGMPECAWSEYLY